MEPRKIASRAAALVARTDMSGGAIAGTVIGCLVGGTLLLFCCIIPLILRARRVRRVRRHNEAHGTEMGLDPEVDVTFAGAVPGMQHARRLKNHFAANGPTWTRGTRDVKDVDGDGSFGPPGSDAWRPDETTRGLTQPAAAYNGLPSPVSPPNMASAAFPGQPPAVSPQFPSPAATAPAGTGKDVGAASMPSPASVDGVMYEGITEEPGTLTHTNSLAKSTREVSKGRKGSKQHSISDSLRRFAHLAADAFQRGSRDDEELNEKQRSPTMGSGDLISARMSGPERIDPIDTEAPGEAYSYYHSFGEEPSTQSPSNYIPVTTSPTTYVSATTAAAPPPIMTRLQFGSSSSAGTFEPMSPVSPGGQAGSNLVQEPDTMARAPESEEQAGKASLLARRGFPEPVRRMDTLPMGAIVPDVVPNRTLGKADSFGVSPMDVMGATTTTERDHHTKHQLERMSKSPPLQPTEASGTFPNQDEPNSAIVSEPTPEATPEPDMGMYIRDDLAGDFQNDQSVPGIEIDGVESDEEDEDVDMEYDYDDDDAASHHVPENKYETPPPSSGPSTHTTPNVGLKEYYGSTPSGTPASPYSNQSDATHSGPSASPRNFRCDFENCGREFDQIHKLNHHRRYHERPHECPYAGCGKKFGTKTHLDRHVNDKHMKTKKYHCLVVHCQYSRQGGKSFPRKDNWRRHMQNKHQITPTHDPDKEMVDEIYGMPPGI